MRTRRGTCRSPFGLIVCCGLVLAGCGGQAAVVNSPTTTTGASIRPVYPPDHVRTTVAERELFARWCAVSVGDTRRRMLALMPFPSRHDYVRAKALNLETYDWTFGRGGDLEAQVWSNGRVEVLTADASAPSNPAITSAQLGCSMWRSNGGVPIG